MKINRALLKYGVSQTFEENIDFSSMSFDPNHIRKIENCLVKINATDFETILCINVEINATVIGVCSYSLEDVKLDIHATDELNFTDDENDEDCYYVTDSIIDLDEYILGILLANIPVRITKKGAKLPKNGSGYRVISEEDYEKEKANSIDHRWDKLDSVQIDDEQK